MKLIIFFSFLFLNSFFAQNENMYERLNDVIVRDAQEKGQNQTMSYVSKISLKGHYQILIVVVGFSDEPGTHNWPHINQANEFYPYRGTFPDGTTLTEKINTTGPVDIEDWYGAGFEDYFEIQSNGKYTADAVFPKPLVGQRYMPNLPLSNWGTGNNIIWYNASVFNNIKMVQFTFDGLPGNKFHTVHGGFTWSGNRIIHDPADSINKTVIYRNI